MKETTVPAPTESKEHMPQDTREEARTIAPPVDIFETESGLAVVADLPGVDKEHVDINVDNNILTIKGSVGDGGLGEPLYAEYRLRNFFRQFELSEEIDQDKIRADMRHGVLTIQLPKVAKAQPRRINVDVQG